MTATPTPITSTSREYQRQWRQRWSSMSADQLLVMYRKAITEGHPVPLVAMQRVNTLLAGG